MSDKEKGRLIVVVLILLTICSMAFKAPAQGHYGPLITDHRYPGYYKNTIGYYTTIGHFNRVDTMPVMMYYSNGDSTFGYKRTWVMSGHFYDGRRKPLFSKGKWTFFIRRPPFWLKVDHKVVGYKHWYNY